MIGLIAINREVRALEREIERLTNLERYTTDDIDSITSSIQNRFKTKGLRLKVEFALSLTDRELIRIGNEKAKKEKRRKLNNDRA